MLDEILTVTFFHFFLIFCRVGTAMIALPGFGEIYVSAQIRLILALLLSLILTPVLTPVLPPIPAGAIEIARLIIAEIFVGALIGGIGRMIQGTLHMAGTIVAFQSGLSSALLFDANQGNQGSVVGNFMTLVGVTMMFVTNLHHLMLQGLAGSYEVFLPGVIPLVADSAELASITLAKGFLVAFEIASPLIVVGLCLYLGLGIMARLMPSMQVFFIIIPVQIVVSFVFLMLSLSIGIRWYLQYFEETMRGLFGF